MPQRCRDPADRDQPAGQSQLDLGGQPVAFTSYAGNDQLFVYGNMPVRITDITDGTSQTFMLGEKRIPH